ncbi:MAG: zinc ribbon domain-containing protein [Coprothermobacterota bacterium]|nr:zinc ribbon domain-containing protein [Coprothermobacterota bacterium]
MPIYEYRCLDCQNKFEVLHLNQEEKEIICPNCGSKNIKRVMSTFACSGLDNVPSSGCSSCSGSSCSSCGL